MRARARVCVCVYVKSVDSLVDVRITPIANINCYVRIFGYVPYCRDIVSAH